MPRFRLAAAFDLIPVLRRLGVEQAFSRQADFSGITEAERLLINAVAHKAYVDVDERGTEAAAATAIAFRPTAAFRAPTPVTMTVDRPFLFAIVDTQTGLPLFIGQVSHPAFTADRGSVRTAASPWGGSRSDVSAGADTPPTGTTAWPPRLLTILLDISRIAPCERRKARRRSWPASRDAGPRPSGCGRPSWPGTWLPASAWSKRSWPGCSP